MKTIIVDIVFKLFGLALAGYIFYQWYEFGRNANVYMYAIVIFLLVGKISDLVDLLNAIKGNKDVNINIDKDERE